MKTNGSALKHMLIGVCPDKKKKKFFDGFEVHTSWLLNIKRLSKNLTDDNTLYCYHKAAKHIIKHDQVSLVFT